MTSQHEITRLLADWSKGDRQALEKLTPLVYDARMDFREGLVER